MPKNQFLQRAKTDIYDEFYTRFEDIEREMNSYSEYNPDVFRDKTILLPMIRSGVILPSYFA